MDNKFVDGFFVKAPRAGAPEFVKGSVSLKREEFMRWVAAQEGEWINLDVKESAKSGKWYAQVNDWKPTGGGMPQMPTFTPPSANPFKLDVLNTTNSPAEPVKSFDDIDDSIPF